MKKILLSVLVHSIIFFTVHAKGWDSVYINKLIAQGEIDKVIDYYKMSYFSSQRDPKDAFKIADLYARKKDYPAAVEWYEKEKQYLKDSKTNLLNLSNAYRMVGNYQKALDGFLMYAAETGDVAAVMDNANLCERLIRASSFADNYFFESYKYNSEADEANVSILRGNLIYTLSKADGPNRIWEATRQYDSWLDPQPVLSKPDEKTGYYKMSFTKDGNAVVYTTKEMQPGNTTNPNREISKVYLATYLGGQLLNIQSFPFNSDLYSCKDPVFNDDGTGIYFSSNMSGGSGGFDIWKSTLLNGKWNKPQNLGKLINSPADETAPFVTSEKKHPVIFYASNRDGGFGGFDIYKAAYTDNTWQGIELQPAPVNSPNNENSFVFDPEIQTGYVSSDRAGGKGGTDIYRIRPLDLKLIVQASDSTLMGPLDYGYIQLYDNNIKIYETVTGNDGISIIQLGLNRDYTLNISKENYRPKTVQFNTKGKYNGDSVFLPIALLKDPQFSVKNSSTGISMQNYIVFMGNITDGNTNKPVQPKMRMVNFNTNKLRILDVDEKGSFLIKLMTNNNYKIYIDNQDNKISDEITTYGLEHGSIKLKNYILSGSQFKTSENRILAPYLVPDSLKYLWKEEMTQAADNGMALSTSIQPATLIADDNKFSPDLKNKDLATEVKDPKTEQKEPAASMNTSTPLTVNENTDIQLTDALYYKIQVGSYTSTMTFPELDGLGQIRESVAYGNYIYRIGDFADLNDAKNKLEKIHQKGYNLAFILQYRKDKIISIIK